jgi:ESS family glutamate:Na+ symporter
MPVYEFTGRQIVVLAILVLYLGEFITHRVALLRKNNIPASVTGGLICSSVVALLAGVGVVKLTFNLELRNLLLLIFFSTIGLNAKLRALAKGGKALVMLVIACAVLLILQNAVGVSVATAFGRHPFKGLFGGSISLAGGHGTAIAWGEIAEKDGIPGASEFGIACATFGLILGGLLGGPIAGRLIKRRNLRPEKRVSKRTNASSKQASASPKEYPVSVDDVIDTVFALALCLALGDAVNRYLFAYEIRLPGFLTAMMVGVALTNAADAVKVNLKHNAIDVIGGVSLQLFLTMSLMSVNLLSLADSVGLLLATMVVQGVVIVFFAVWVVFRMMGGNYDAAVITGGLIGLGLGATPVAIASMDAVSKRHGPSIKAFLVVPLVGAFFIDLINAAVIGGFQRLPLFQ